MKRTTNVVFLALVAVLAMSPGLEAASPTLDAIQGLPQAWDKILPANDPGGACPSNSSRFTCVMGGAAVRDNETGLVWDLSPDSNARNWLAAQLFCNQKIVGNRKGWRLPTIQELASLVDPGQSFPALPSGHPFGSVQSFFYWSATTYAADSGYAWFVNFQLGDLGVFSTTGPFTWCVRGGQGVNSQ